MGMNKSNNSTVLYYPVLLVDDLLLWRAGALRHAINSPRIGSVHHALHAGWHRTLNQCHRMKSRLVGRVRYFDTVVVEHLPATNTCAREWYFIVTGKTTPTGGRNRLDIDRKGALNNRFVGLNETRNDQKQQAQQN
jgi:hypothetical protein